MANSIYGIGTSALSAAQAGLLTAGHNISNANTEGYSRQRVGQASNVPLYSGGAWLGQGVHTESIRRQYDDLLAGELRTAQAQAGHSQAYLNQLQSIAIWPTPCQAVALDRRVLRRRRRGLAPFGCGGGRAVVGRAGWSGASTNSTQLITCAPAPCAPRRWVKSTR
jgi:hypothetical protein